MVWPWSSEPNHPTPLMPTDVPTFANNTLNGGPSLITALAYTGLTPLHAADAATWYYMLKGRQPAFETTLSPHNLAKRLNYAERSVCLDRLSQVRGFAHSLLHAARVGTLAEELGNEFEYLDNTWVVEKLSAEHRAPWDWREAREEQPWSNCPSDAVITSGLENYKEVMAYCTEDWMGETGLGDGDEGWFCKDRASRDPTKSLFGPSGGELVEKLSPVSFFVFLTVLAGIAGFVYIISRLLKGLEEQVSENRRLSESYRRLSNALMFPTSTVEEVELVESTPVVAPRRKSRARRGE